MGKIYELKNGQIMVTIPRSIASAMQLKKGDSIEFILMHGDVVIRKT